ncbi:MAG TPA: tetratricopeptide repeat protein [Terriglobales bacterium]|nr:tetratricopeptide repeat protein [Terriglobales bacterium]
MGRAGRSWIAGLIFLAWLLVNVASGQSNAYEQELKKGIQAAQQGDVKEAEKHYRAAIKAQPDSWEAHSRLADTFFLRARFQDSIPEYEKAHELAAAGHLSAEEERHLNDQLAIAYMIASNFDKAIEVYRTVLAKDPDYPPYYYNLACTYAAKGDLDHALSSLREAYARKDKWPQGQMFPNPRKDTSFKRYAGDEKFEKLGREVGF